MRRQALTLGVTGLLLAACATPLPPFEAAGWRRTDLDVGGRKLAVALSPLHGSSEVLTVVIEGDGRAHDIDGRPSTDPTPDKAVGFQIARAWPRRPVAWLGRLCQYVRAADPHCAPADWTTGRFSDDAIVAASAAVDDLKRMAGARRIALVGWSGGGVLAALLATRRADVTALTTIAAPLDLAAWTRANRISPLSGSRDPAREAGAVIPQAHLFGSRDTITAPGLMEPAAPVWAAWSRSGPRRTSAAGRKRRSGSPR
jgi:pimeloyl-ACP methyl ester carboxylesterase